MCLVKIGDIVRRVGANCELLVFGSFLDPGFQSNDLDLIIRFSDGEWRDAQRLALAVSDAYGAWCDLTVLSVSEDDAIGFSKEVGALPLARVLQDIQDEC